MIMLLIALFNTRRPAELPESKLKRPCRGRRSFPGAGGTRRRQTGKTPATRLKMFRCDLHKRMHARSARSAP